MMTRCRRIPSLLLVLLGACLAGLAGTAWSAAAGDRRPMWEPTEDVERQIAELIEQMGAEQYASRERAQEQLRELGLVAFDALLEATRHDDVEIALRARYLVRSMPVQWSFDSDPAAVKSILANYSQASRDERQNRMQQLAALPDATGVPALCRLMRFESDALLSKQAALFVMGYVMPPDEAAKKQVSDTIRATVGLSKRPAAIWLRTYADTLLDPASTVERWEEIARSELQDFAQFPERTDRLVVRDLFRWHADMLRRLGREQEFVQAVERTLDLIEGDMSELFDVVDWALEREAWTVVDQVAERFPDEFFRHAILVYRLAEAQLKRGDEELAEQTAQRALGIDADHPESHNLLAEFLTSRLLYRWAEQEYRFVISKTTPSPNDGLHLEARFFLADMLFDLQRYGDAADVLKPAVEAIQDNPKLLQPTLRSAAEVRASWHYYQALNHDSRGEHEKQVEQLKLAFQEYPANPDYLIAMYHVTHAGEEFREEVRKRVDAAQGRLRDRIQLYERVLQGPRNETERLEAMELLARTSNELAWLIANTEGDFEAALQHSKRSLELKPDSPAYLDTLGRCYYALEDYENAVLYQTRAVERAPSYQQIRRQLELFQKALEKSKQEQPAPS